MTNVINFKENQHERLVGLIKMAAEWLAEYGDLPVALLKSDGTLLHHDLVRFEIVEDNLGEKYFAFKERAE